MNAFHRWLLLAVLALGPSFPLSAAPLSPQDVPEPLRPWVKWVLLGHEQQRCPFLYNNGDQHWCSWPSRLELQLTDQRGAFTQHWLVLIDGWVPLPGDGTHWPQEVRLDTQPVLVSERAGVPSVYVQTGDHTLSGVFLWDTLPEALPIPRETGLVTLTVNNTIIDFPDLDNTGRLWVQKRAVAGEEHSSGDRLDLKVYRRIVDDIPLLLTTRIDLEVSGKPREELLGQAMPEGYIPMSLESPLPARLEPDGRLRAQVRPGRWSIVLTVRHPGPVNAITLQPTAGSWVAEEVWVFEARPHVRLVTVAGVPAIDPQQTSLPEDWRRLPAYHLHPGDTLQMVEKRRGDPDPAPDQLVLERSLWLDFDGGGYTIQDHITGTMTRGWRLNLNPPARLGRVAVDGQDQFITRREGSERTGVEVRRGQIMLVADSRIESRAARLPAVGWEQDFHQVSGVLHLPPGWRVFSAAGVDDMPDTWLQQWTLLDFFLILFIALATARLWSRPWGILALVTLTLVYHESQAPRWIWLHVLTSMALLRVLPAGRAARVMQLYRNLSLVALVAIALPFMVRQARQGLYPQLEKPWQMMEGRPVTQAAPAPAMIAQEELAKRRGAVVARSMREGAEGDAPDESIGGHYGFGTSSTLTQYDPNALIQTGPGLPHWQWTSIPMRWNGPVDRSQHLHLILIPPWGNTLLAFLRVLLLAALLLGVLHLRYTRGSGLRYVPFTPASPATMAIALFFLLTPGGAVAWAEFPSPQLLDELRNRLLEKAECLPQCAVSPRLRLDITPQTLRARLEIHSSASVAVPLPGQAQQWLPQTVLLNGQPAHGLLRTEAGHLWIEVPAGRHQVLAEGPLPVRETVQLLLPLKSHRVAVEATGWAVEGLHENGDDVSSRHASLVLVARLCLAELAALGLGVLQRQRPLAIDQKNATRLRGVEKERDGQRVIAGRSTIFRG